MKTTTFHIILAGLILPLLAAAQPLLLKHEGSSGVMVWQVERQSRLVIRGNSNITAFSCDASEYKRSDTLALRRSVENGSLAFNGQLALQLIDLNCHNGIITSDLRKTLRVDEYPSLEIRFLSMENTAIEHLGAGLPVMCQLQIGLAGSSRIFNLPFYISSRNGQTCMKGSKTFCFKDFNLSPPSRLGGLVKVKDEFLVEVNLLLNRIK
jgi:hypothetical protein